MNGASYKNLLYASSEEETEINFDNAATTPPLRSVISAVCSFAADYSSVHRGGGKKSIAATELFERCRMEIMRFVNADSEHDTLVFTKNTTEAINKLSYRLKSDDGKNIVISTEMEHHSNSLPWRRSFQVEYALTDACGLLLIDDLEAKLKKLCGKVRLVAVTGASNVTGYMNDIYGIAELAHKYGAEIFVDAAQLAPHAFIDMQAHGSPRHIDYIAFSAHKMYAPFGTGVLIAPKKTLMNGSPEYSGGGTVRLVTKDTVIWENPPFKDEAGTPNIMGVIAMAEAVRTLSRIGMQKIAAYEEELTAYAHKKLENIPHIRLYAESPSAAPRIGVLPFNIEDIFHEEIAAMLAHEAGIAVRSGCFCAQPYIQKLMGLNSEQIAHYIKNPALPRPGMVRVSLGFYNKKSEIDKLCDFLEQETVKRKSSRAAARKTYDVRKHF